jgi:hypothetical protein
LDDFSTIAHTLGVVNDYFQPWLTFFCWLSNAHAHDRELFDAQWALSEMLISTRQTGYVTRDAELPAAIPNLFLEEKAYA